jgi:hypothetical protein
LTVFCAGILFLWCIMGNRDLSTIRCNICSITRNNKTYNTCITKVK